MEHEANTLKEEAQSLYVGIDVHKKDWRVQILGEFSSMKPFSQPADSQALISHLKKNYPDTAIQCAYEAGFSGFGLYRDLKKAGIKCLVVHPADIPTTDKEKRHKSDAIDANKLAMNLKAGSIKGIHVPTEKIQALRGFVRFRKRMVKNQTRTKNRIKHFLMHNGVQVPQELANENWSAAYVAWLKSIPFKDAMDRLVLDGYLIVLETGSELIKKANKELVNVSKESVYQPTVQLIRSVPGIGLQTSMILLSELGDINRFSSVDKLCSYIGLVPHMHASGENEYTGNMTIRGNKWVKGVMIECAWSSIHKDPALFGYFNHYCLRMKKNEAIIRITKKLLSRLRHVLKEKENYSLGIT